LVHYFAESGVFIIRVTALKQGATAGFIHSPRTDIDAILRNESYRNENF
jgi:hypothetical protein